MRTVLGTSSVGRPSVDQHGPFAFQDGVDALLAERRHGPFQNLQQARLGFVEYRHLEPNRGVLDGLVDPPDLGGHPVVVVLVRVDQHAPHLRDPLERPQDRRHLHEVGARAGDLDWTTVALTPRLCGIAGRKEPSDVSTQGRGQDRGRAVTSVNQRRLTILL